MRDGTVRAQVTDSRPARLLLLRHGQTTWNVQERLAGLRDDVLTVKGQEQAKALGRWLATQPPPDVFYVSGLRRTHETARFIQEQLSRVVDVRVDPHLNEIHFGEAEGLSIAEVLQRFPYLSPFLRSVEADHPDWSWPGGESRVAYYERVITRIQDLLNRHQGQTVVLVTHGGVINGFLTWWQRGLLGYTEHFTIPNCSITEIVTHGNGLSVVRIAETPWSLTTASSGTE